ncbi:hypothetical protein V6Z12_A08G142100 [Gossypium hirsutum]
MIRALTNFLFIINLVFVSPNTPFWFIIRQVEKIGCIFPQSETFGTMLGLRKGPKG